MSTGINVGVQHGYKVLRQRPEENRTWDIAPYLNEIESKFISNEKRRESER